jgi:hypothetical protein
MNFVHYGYIILLASTFVFDPWCGLSILRTKVLVLQMVTVDRCHNDENEKKFLWECVE